MTQPGDPEAPGGGSAEVAPLVPARYALRSALHKALIGTPETLRAKARGILEDPDGPLDLASAKGLLLRALGMDSLDAGGKTRYLLGLVCFHQERWDESELHLVAALRSAANPQASALLARVRTNMKTGIERAVDPIPPFDPQALRKPAALAIRAPELSGRRLREQEKGLFIGLLDRALGRILGWGVERASALVYFLLRDRKKVFAFESWDRLPTFLGLLYLGAMRHDLNGDKLQSTYEGVLVGEQPPGQQRPKWTERFRTATGAWTTDDPMEGAAGTEIQRSGAPLALRRSRLDDETLPSPREVSRRILAPLPNHPRQEVPFLNLLTIAWIQAQLHDWVSHRPTPVPGTHPVKLQPGDPLRECYGIGALQVQLSAANPMPAAKPLTYLNEVTHWWDASHIYGSDQDTQDRLRSGADGRFLADGKLRIEDGDLLPLNPQTRIEDSGFTRNWWVGLDLIHTLFVKHHNFICGKLREEFRAWTSDEIFHTARLINAATMAKIHTVEWTPAVLPNRKLVTGMDTNWWGLFQTLTPVHKRRVHVLGEPVDPVLGGIVGGARDNHGKPYGMSEEFTEVYRLHAGIPDEIRLPQGAAVPTDATRGDAARALVRKLGMPALLGAFGRQHMPALVNNNYPAFMCELSVHGQPVIDIGTIDILRARERGVPPYNEFREMLGLKGIARFEDLGCSAEAVQALEALYGRDGVDRLDLLAGTSCELWRPENYGFGETMFTIFIQMASRRLHADPFYTEKFDERHYTRIGMQLIETATLKGVLLQHYPALAQQGLDNVHNAFEPWGTTAATHPEEHPLARIVDY